MNKKTLWKAGLASIVLILVFVILYSGLQIVESAALLREEQTGEIRTKTITRDGIKYFPRQDLRVILFMGVDQPGEVKASAPNYAEGVDVVALLVVDETNQEVRILTLNRDTMMDIYALDSHGRPSGTVYDQLTVSHMFGTGLEDSCENTRKTVSKFLYGINIDHYVAVNYDAIPLLNDAVGGVTVTVEDDFSRLDPTMQKGPMTLMGEQALYFVQHRKRVGDELNVSRMKRQEEYMRTFAQVFREKAEADDLFVISAYEQIAPYLVTDCSATVMSDMMSRYEDYTLTEIVTPEGENILGEQYYEFYVDEEKLDDLVIRLFYAEK